MAATIKDIAKIVGVSPSTVSRVINESAPISEEIKEKIRIAMEELNYHPNSRARTLVTGSTYTIALVVDAADEKSFSNTFFDRSVYAIERKAQENGYNLLITNDLGKTGSSIKELVYEKKVDGLIIPSSSTKKSLVELLEAEHMPWVALGEPATGKKDYYWVDIDNYAGSLKAVEFLTENGYQNVAYVTGNPSTVFTKRRIKGFCDGLKFAGYKTPEENVIEHAGVEGELEEQLLRIIEEKKIDAFVCSDNVLAYHTLKAIRTAKKKVPEIGIITFDNHPFAEYMDPPLTVIDVNTYKLGEKAAELLIGRIRNRNIGQKEVLIPTDLIVRQSTKGRYK